MELRGVTRGQGGSCHAGDATHSSGFIDQLSVGVGPMLSIFFQMSIAHR